MILYSQTDPRWGEIKLGKSPCTIKRWGCTITSICILLSKLDSQLTPKDAATRFKFTPDGLLDWGSDFSPLKFIKRVRTFTKEDEAEVKKLIKEGAFVILNVKNRYIPSHWIAADRVSGLGFIAAVDPLGGKGLWNVKAYYTIIGYSVFNKK